MEACSPRPLGWGSSGSAVTARPGGRPAGSRTSGGRSSCSPRVGGGRRDSPPGPESAVVDVALTGTDYHGASAPVAGGAGPSRWRPRSRRAGAASSAGSSRFRGAWREAAARNAAAAWLGGPRRRRPRRSSRSWRARPLTTSSSRPARVRGARGRGRPAGRGSATAPGAHSIGSGPAVRIARRTVRPRRGLRARLQVVDHPLAETPSLDLLSHVPSDAPHRGISTAIWPSAVRRTAFC